MARESYPHILAGNLGEKLTVGDVAVEAHLVVFDFRLSGRHRRVWRSILRRRARQRLRRRGQRDLTRGLRQGCAHFIRTEADFSWWLASFFGLIQLLYLFLEGLGIGH